MSSLLLTALVIVPTLASGQVVDRPRKEVRPGMPDEKPAELPQKPRLIARDTQYTTRPYYWEVYPIYSSVNAPGRSWSALAAGARVGYDVARISSLTLDLTSTAPSFALSMQTVEAGTRLQSHRLRAGLHPFIDLRAGYLLMQDARPPSSTGFLGEQSFRAAALILGVGAEYGVTRTISLTGLSSIVRSSAMGSSNPAFVGDGAIVSSLRFAFGLKYNPGRFLNRPTLPTRE